MKKRHPAAVLLLPVVTLGIYCIYWLYATRKELLSASGNKKDSIPPVFVMFLPILLFVGLVVAGILFSAGGDAATTAAENEPLGVGGIVTAIILIGFFVGGILLLPLWWFWKYCKVAVQVTKDKGMDFTQLYVLYVAIVWLCGIAPVWMLIAQLDFNKVADASAHPPAIPPSHDEHPQHEASASTKA